MAERQDALAAMSEIILDPEEAAQTIAETKSPSAVGTAGKVDIDPNAKNVVPGSVTATLDIRAVEYDVMNEIVTKARQGATQTAQNRPVTIEFDRYRDQRPSHMSTRCYNAAIDAAADHTIEYHQMQSTAMHDTANVADVTDTLLLFAPSEDGISHNPCEWTDWDDCARATQVLAGTMARLATDGQFSF